MCLGGGAKSSCQRVLWIDGSASYGQMGLQSLSPCYLGKIIECSTSEQGAGPKAAHSHCWAWIMVWPGGARPLKLIKDSLDSAGYHGILVCYVVPKVQ